MFMEALLGFKIEDEEVLQNYEAFLKNELNPNENWYNDMPESVKKRLQKSVFRRAWFVETSLFLTL